MGYKPEDAEMRIKQLIPLDPNECALLKYKYVNEDGEQVEDWFDATSENWGVYRALFCSREEYDGNISTYDVAFFETPPDMWASGFADPDELRIVPNYKCENCGNRMIPSIGTTIHYRCPVCSSEMDFCIEQPTLRERV